MLGSTEYKNPKEIVLNSETFQQASWRVKCDTITVQLINAMDIINQILIQP